MSETQTTELVPVTGTQAELPPILLGRATPTVARQVESFYNSVAEIFERWVKRRESKHTQRAYKGDVLAFVEYLDLRWPEADRALVLEWSRAVRQPTRIVIDPVGGSGIAGVGIPERGES